MPDGDPRHSDPPSDRPAVGGLRLFQFSLSALFVITTAMALILSAYFSIGRWIGMSTMDVVTRGLVRLLYAAPTLLVWIVALTFAIGQRRRYRLPATLTIVALAGLVLTAFVVEIGQMVLIHLVESGRIDHTFVGWGFAIIRVFYTVFNAGGWVLILVAVFVHRTPDVPAGRGKIDSASGPSPCPPPPRRSQQTRSRWKASDANSWGRGDKDATSRLTLRVTLWKRHRHAGPPYSSPLRNSLE